MSELAGMDKRAQAGAEALRRGRPDAARDIYLELTGIWPSNAEAWHGLALACRALEETDGEMAALDRLLAVDPDHIAALLMKADHFARTGDGRAAHAFYSEAATRGTAQPGITPSLRAEVKRAERERERLSTSFDHHLEAALAKAGFDPARSSPRFARSLDLLFGRRKIYLQSPTAFYFPGLPQREFYERHEFSWLSELEAKTPAIREELLEVLCQEAAFEPYVRSTGARPKREYGQLLDSPEWSAFYIIRFGEMVEDAARLCPATLEALRCAPLCEARSRTPAVLFSALRPGARIPPHTGYTNARLICHLPLIVPEGCGLRVGSEIRAWREGEALIFDDSMEHEAWNESGELRVVLLFDIWRPELTEEERSLVAATLSAVADYDQRPWD